MKNTTRKSMTSARRRRSYEFHGGRCCLCSLPIDAVKDAWIVEHMSPLWLGGKDDDENTAPAHQTCAVAKTKAEATVRAKVFRVREKHIGAKKASRRPLPGSKASGWSKKMDGTVVRRGK